MALVSQSFILVLNPDGTLDSDFPAGDKDPQIEDLAWGLVGGQGVFGGLNDAGISEIEEGTPFSFDVRQYLTGTNAASATIAIVPVSGDDPETSGWTAPGSGDNLVHDAVAPGSGTFKLSASFGGDTALTDGTFTWECVETASSGEASFVEQGDPGYLPIIPGIRGFGTETVAGSGRHGPGTTVLYVNSTSTGNSGSGNTGTFLWCLTRSFPRTIVFTISGLIEYPQGQSIISIDNPYMSVHFETAPSPGIHIWNLPLRVKTHDILFSHYSGMIGEFSSQPTGCHIELNGAVGDVGNLVLANCTGLFQGDGAFQAFTTSSGANFEITGWTVWRCISALGQDDSGVTGAPGWGAHGVFQDSTTIANFTIAQNLFAHTRRRNPKLDAGVGNVDNNLIYNIKTIPMEFSTKTVSGATRSRWNIRRNGFVRGPNQPNNACIITAADNNNYPADAAHFHHANNVKSSDLSVMFSNTAGQAVSGSPDAQAVPPGFNLYTIADSQAGLLQFANLIRDHVGARPLDRLSIVQGVCDNPVNRLTGTGSQGAIIANPTSIGWPISIAENTVDHSTGGDPIPPPGTSLGQWGQIMPSGYTRGEEWLHRKYFALCPAGADK